MSPPERLSIAGMRFRPSAALAVVLCMLTASAQAQWTYLKKQDAMRNTAATVARMQSTNAHASGLSTGRQTRLMLVAWDDPSNDNPELRKTVGFFMSTGMFNCPSSKCVIHMKVDDGPVEALPVYMNDDYDLLWLDSNGAERFTAAAATGKQVIVEVPLYRTGDRQFTFRLSPLRWPN